MYTRRISGRTFSRSASCHVDDRGAISLRDGVRPTSTWPLTPRNRRRVLPTPRARGTPTGSNARSRTCSRSSTSTSRARRIRRLRGRPAQRGRAISRRDTAMITHLWTRCRRHMKWAKTSHSPSAGMPEIRREIRRGRSARIRTAKRAATRTTRPPPAHNLRGGAARLRRREMRCARRSIRCSGCRGGWLPSRRSSIRRPDRCRQMSTSARDTSSCARRPRSGASCSSSANRRSTTPLPTPLTTPLPTPLPVPCAQMDAAYEHMPLQMQMARIRASQMLRSIEQKLRKPCAAPP